jgi:hypothetical protein
MEAVDRASNDRWARGSVMIVLCVCIVAVDSGDEDQSNNVELWLLV